MQQQLNTPEDLRAIRQAMDEGKNPLMRFVPACTVRTIACWWLSVRVPFTIRRPRSITRVACPR